MTDFRNPLVQSAILSHGTREDLIAWLSWNDPNGVWTDKDSRAEGWEPITLESARAAMQNALADDLGAIEQGELSL